MGSRFVVVERTDRRSSNSLPPGTREVAKADDLEDIISVLRAKSGLEYQDGE